jgi:hypothetical protein
LIMSYYDDSETLERFATIESTSRQYWNAVNPGFTVSVFEIENEGMTTLHIEVFNEYGALISDQRYT